MSKISKKDYSDSKALLEFMARALWTITWTVICVSGSIALGILGGVVSGLWGGIKDA